MRDSEHRHKLVNNERHKIYETQTENVTFLFLLVELLLLLFKGKAVKRNARTFFVFVKQIRCFLHVKMTFVLKFHGYIFWMNRICCFITLYSIFLFVCVQNQKLFHWKVLFTLQMKNFSTCRHAYTSCRNCRFCIVVGIM